MWPSEYTLWLLLVGLSPLIYVCVLGIKLGVQEIVSLRFIGVLLIWLGYQFSALWSFLAGEIWESYLLVPDQIDTGLAFSALAMIAFLIGYSSVFRARISLLRRSSSATVSIPSVRPRWVFWLSVVVLALTILNVGGLDEFWASAYPRGYGQFVHRDAAVLVERAVSVIRLPLEIVLGLMASLLVIQNKGSLSSYLLGFSALTIASMGSIWSFSRGAGFPFFVLAFMALRLGSGPRYIIALLGLSFALFLGSVGLQERNSYFPGIANFTEAAVSMLVRGRHAGDSSEGEAIYNPVDAMPSFTRKSQQRDFESPSPVAMGAKYLWNLNPLPSAFIPIYPIGRSLTDVMGTSGSVGITTPSFAEMYYVFGFFGVAVVALVGVVVGWFERLVVMKPSVVSSIAIVLVFISLAISLHSTTRAMTRPMIYAGILIWLGNKIFATKKVDY